MSENRIQVYKLGTKTFIDIDSLIEYLVRMAAQNPKSRSTILSIIDNFEAVKAAEIEAAQRQADEEAEAKINAALKAPGNGEVN